MLIVFHVIIALASMVYATIGAVQPSHSTLRATYTLFTLTLLSGTYLVALKPTHLTQSCMEGLMYCAAISLGLFTVHSRLAKLPKAA